ncbi:response regulator [Deinococcus sedimenti]|uniref:Response regulator n=1 Tax=Deinococcus sedimenti TaxID=1867090 RepID=A0ABQ2S805_9DEIO|nr:response regulator [Deinococcus sedimenti]GGS01448.1 response regulator [Deinococcus sedimenti]
MTGLGRDRRQLHVLLVDDDPEDRALVAEVVTRLATPVTVHALNDGPGAIAWLSEQAERAQLPDVIMLDIRMPGVSGLEVLRALREDERLRSVPVVMLTTSSNEEDVDASYRLAASGYFVKDPDYAAFARQMQVFAEYWTSVKASGDGPLGARAGR